MLMVESLFLHELEPEPVKKILGAGAGQKWTGSATLVSGSGSTLHKTKEILNDILFVGSNID